MDAHRREPLLRATWLAAAAAVCTLLAVSPAVSVATPLERAVFAPAAWAMEQLSARRGYLNPAMFPLVAALQLLALGLALDARRIVRGLRRGRPRLGPDGDPLWVWKATLALTLALVAAAYFANRHAEHRFFAFDADRQRREVSERGDILADLLEDARRHAGGPRRVVLIGDSMMGAALVRNPLVEAGLTKDRAVRVDLVRLTLGGLELVEVRPFVDEVLALEPALVVLDANFLFTKVGNVFLLHHYGRAARWANAALDRLEGASRALGFARGGSAQYAPAELPGHVGEAGAADEGEARDRWEGRRASAHDPNYVFAAELLAELRRRGVPACITTVPVSEVLRPYVDGFLGEARPLVAELAARAEVPLFLHEPYAPDAWYVDTVHMNDAGKPVYSAWFVRHLRPLLDRAGPVDAGAYNPRAATRRRTEPDPPR